MAFDQEGDKSQKGPGDTKTGQSGSKAFENLQNTIARGAGSSRTAVRSASSQSNPARSSGSVRSGSNLTKPSGSVRSGSNLTKPSGSVRSGSNLTKSSGSTPNRSARNNQTGSAAGTRNRIAGTAVAEQSASRHKSPDDSWDSEPAGQEIPASVRKKKKSQRKPKKWYQKRSNQVKMQLGAMVLGALLIVILAITLITKLIGNHSSGNNSAETVSAVSVSSVSASLQSVNAQETAPGAEDGTGTAGIMQVTPDRVDQGKEPGWHDTGLGKIWYALDNSMIYYKGWQDIDGNTYHFTEDGYADRGWVLIGGQSCYFDDQGIYHPDQDNSKLVAFTFDDGPSQGMDEILALCEETGARVTFFMIGVQVEEGGAVIPHIMADRCELGNHSYSHSQMVDKSVDEVVADFAQCDSLIASFSGGPESTVVRFPYGDFTSEQTAAVGKANVFWNIDSLDWDLLDADKVYDQVMPNITEGDIILMHDRHETTVEACRKMFPELIAEGYQIVTISELAAAKGYTLEPGMTYFSFCDDEIAEGKAFRTEK